jgi:hypothetical protein
MSAPNPYGPPSAADLALEARIEAAQLALSLAPRKDRRAAFEALRRLVLSRSPEQQARMAVARGLPA